MTKKLTRLTSSKRHLDEEQTWKIAIRNLFSSLEIDNHSSSQITASAFCCVRLCVKRQSKASFTVVSAWSRRCLISSCASETAQIDIFGGSWRKKTILVFQLSDPIDKFHHNDDGLRFDGDDSVAVGGIL